MSTFIEQLAQQTGSQALGGIMGLVLGGINDRRQLQQQQQLQNMQIKGQKEMTDYNFQKQMQMWLDTNYSAQKDQLKKAGLNPGLIYGMGGAGGATTGGGSGNVQGASAPAGGGEIRDMMGMGIQYQLLKAQKDNIEAQTKKTLGEAQNLPLQGENIKASTASLTQGIENQKAQQELLQVETDIKRIEEHIKGKTQNLTIARISYETEEALERLGIIQNEHRLSDKTLLDQISIVKARMFGAWLSNELTRAQTANTKIQTEFAPGYYGVEYSKMLQIAQQLGINQQNADTQRNQQLLNEWVDDLSKSTGLPLDLLEKAAQAIFLKSILQGNDRTPIQGFHKR